MTLRRRQALGAAAGGLAGLAWPALARAQKTEAEALWPGATWAQDRGGWNAAGLARADEVARRLGNHALLVVHRGVVVHEQGDGTLPCNLYSARKSVASMLLGMQVDRGRLRLSSTLAELGIDDQQALSAAEKQATVQQLLQARSGVYHPAAYETPAMKAARPARGSHAPGTFWYYNNWDFNVLARIYEIAAGKTLFEGLNDELARPLGFEHFKPQEHTRWEDDRSTRYPAYVMELSARDLARLGLLMARGGRWREQALLSPAWVAESTTAYSTVGAGWQGYGYLWWVPQRAFPFWTRAPGELFCASGNFGQRLWVDRGRDLVIVANTNHRNWLRSSPDDEQYAALLAPIIGALPA